MLCHCQFNSTADVSVSCGDIRFFFCGEEEDRLHCDVLACEYLLRPFALHTLVEQRHIKAERSI